MSPKNNNVVHKIVFFFFFSFQFFLTSQNEYIFINQKALLNTRMLEQRVFHNFST